MVGPAKGLKGLGPFLRVVLATTALLIIAVPITRTEATQPKRGLCNELLPKLNQPGRLGQYKLEEVDAGEGNFSILNIDIDGDKKPDKLTLFRTGSSSIVPPDDDTLTVTLSSTGKEFEAEFQRFYVIRYGAKVYVVGSAVASESGPVALEILQIGRTGLTKVCSFSCGLAVNTRCKPVHT